VRRFERQARERARHALRRPATRIASRRDARIDRAVDNATMSDPTVYERLGGEVGVRHLVRRFYALMDERPDAQAVRLMHPDSLARSEESLFKFLSGWFGGPPLYMQERGHPRLRMRHMPFRIGEEERNAWMQCMSQALEEQVEDPTLRRGIEHAFSEMATHLINRAVGQTE
jgi:hemoglobin